MKPTLCRIGDKGCLVLIGGGEFSFEETERVDAAWLARTETETPVGFLPAASGSEDYAGHFAVYLDEYFGRPCETLPIYRARDARRGRNAERIDSLDAVYIGGGVADHLVEALVSTPCAEALVRCLGRGGTVVAIASGAQALGRSVRSLFGSKVLDGLDWLQGGVIESNFESSGSERRLRQLVSRPGATWGLGIPAGSAVFLGPDGTVEVEGEAWWIGDGNGELLHLPSTDPPRVEPII